MGVDSRFAIYKFLGNHLRYIPIKSSSGALPPSNDRPTRRHLILARLSFSLEEIDTRIVLTTHHPATSSWVQITNQVLSKLYAYRFCRLDIIYCRAGNVSVSSGWSMVHNISDSKYMTGWVDAEQISISSSSSSRVDLISAISLLSEREHRCMSELNELIIIIRMPVKTIC